MFGQKKSTRLKLLLNTYTSVLFEIVTIACALILPRLIIQVYGSEVNGLVSSISQFLYLISFLDLGVGSVVQSSLYKPLAIKDYDSVSRIVTSAQKFFERIALILLIYVVILVGVYPLVVNRAFDWLYSSALVIAMSISYFAQYYFGVVDRLLLLANQEGYVQYIAQIVTLVLNTVVSVIIIHNGASIQIVKLVTSIIFLARPIFLRYYVNRCYNIDRKAHFVGEPIKQKWSGFVQHVSYVVLTSTDTIVLTFFSTLANVSIYSVYHMVIYGSKRLLISMTGGIKAVIGDLWAKNDKEKLLHFFGTTEFAIHIVTVFAFTCTWKLILPFVQIYTKCITDTEYIQPVFATILLIAHAIHCIRIPYNMLILATGAYKETQTMHVITALINVGVSIIAVINFGLIGVAIGTMVAILYQTLWMINYDSRNNICWPVRNVCKQFLFDVVTVIGIIAITNFVEVGSSDYLRWFISALEIAFISGAVISALSLCFYREQFISILKFFGKSKGRIR